MAAPNGFYCLSLIGGGAGALDSIAGGSITNNDIAIVLGSGLLYHYKANTLGGKAEASPLIIVPDAAPGSINWELQDCEWMIDNDGAVGEETTTLPTGATGLHFKAAVTVAQYLKIQAAGTDIFSHLGSSSAAAGYIRSNTIGNYVSGSWVGGEWLITNIGGMWNYDI